MPEGDTVWRTARRLHTALSGRPLTRTEFRVPAYATVDLAGETVASTTARGKHLLTRLEEGLTLHTHLKMEGSWHLYRPGSRWRRPAYEARVVLTSADWVAVGFALGVVELLPTAEEGKAVGHLGPDLLGPDWDEAEALRRLRAEPGSPIGEALLDQRNLAGIGNLYKMESLYVAGVDPFRPVADVPDLPRLIRLARRMMLANREEPLQVTTGVARRGDQHWVFGRAGKPCRRCGTVLRSATQGDPPRARVTVWCPACQG